MPANINWVDGNYYDCRIYTNDTKTTGVTAGSVTDLFGASWDLALNAPYTYSVTLPLAEPLLAAITKNQYIELKIGWQAKQTKFSGYITQVQQSDTRAGDFQITARSAMSRLAQFVGGGGQEYFYPAYQSIIDVLNGVNALGVAAVPGQYGVLPPGWVAVWTGGGSPPGLGDSWRNDWASSLLGLQRIADRYKLFFRERPGSTWANGVIDIGPLGDFAIDPHTTANVTIWGGHALHTQIIATNPGDQWNTADLAAQLGLIQVASAELSRDASSQYNLVWGVGHGAGPNGEQPTTIQVLFGVPADGSGTPLAGWRRWPLSTDPGYSANQRTMYIQTSANAHSWQGHSFTVVARQQQNGEYEYGILDLTSVAAVGLIKEAPLHDPKGGDQRALLSSLLGYIETTTNPIDTWTFQIQHPLNDANQVPAVVLPGQQIQVNWDGYVAESQQYNPTTGQWDGTGVSYTYMTFPGTTDPAIIALLQNVVEVQGTLSGNGCTETYVLGKGKADKRKYDDALAKKFEHHTHSGRSKHPGFKEKDLDGIPVWCSQSVSGGPGDAYIDPVSGQLVMGPGSIVVTDITQDKIIDNRKRLTFRFILSDPSQLFEIWACKHIDQQLTSTSSTQPYVVLRIAGATSGYNSGFYVNGGIGPTYVATGAVVHDARVNLLDSNLCVPIGTYEIQLTMDGNSYEAFLARPDPDPNETDQVWVDFHLAQLSDTAPAGGSPTFNNKGALGWHVVGGSGHVLIDNMSARKQPQAKIGSAHTKPSVPHKHHWHGMQFGVKKFDRTTQIVTIRMKPQRSNRTQPATYYGALQDDTNHEMRGDDGTRLFWTAPLTFTGKPGDYMVLNGTIFDLTDSQGNPIHPNHFGCITNTKKNKISHEHVYVVARLTPGYNQTYKRPEIQGHHTNSTPGRPGRQGVTRSTAGSNNPQAKTKGKTAGTYNGYASISRAIGKLW